MKNLLIDATKKTPEIIFRTTGDLMITGSSLPANIIKFYQPILDWLEEFKTLSPKKITITFDLEHINTSSTRMILQILRIVSSIASAKNNIRIIWQYENEDKDMLEQGEALKEIIKKPFEFIEKEN